MIATDFKDDRIARCKDSGRTGQPCKETNFADEFALSDLGDRANPISFVYRKATGQHDEEPVRWIAFANQDLTAP